MPEKLECREKVPRLANRPVNYLAGWKRAPIGYRFLFFTGEKTPERNPTWSVVIFREFEQQQRIADPEKGNIFANRILCFSMFPLDCLKKFTISGIFLLFRRIDSGFFFLLSFFEAFSNFVNQLNTIRRDDPSQIRHCFDLIPKFPVSKMTSKWVNRKPSIRLCGQWKETESSQKKFFFLYSECGFLFNVK